MLNAMKTNMQKYPAYKDSGVEWLGEIPEYWEILKGKWLFVKEERPARKEDGIVTCFRDGEVTLRTNRKTEGFTIALKEHGYQGIRKGDLVIHNMDAFAGAIGISDSDGKSTPVYSACTSRIPNKVNSYYYAYFLKNLAKSGFIESLAKGIRERSTDFRFNDFGLLLLSVPPLPEQTAIAAFLDRKTASIEQAIGIKQKQIELLKERRQILIHKAVTRGLNPNAKMKDSGVEWIGEVPEHWSICKIKLLIEIKDGTHDTPAYVNAGMDTYPLATTKHVTSGVLKLEDASHISSNDYFEIIKRSNVEIGDILMPMIGTIGSPIIIESEEKFAIKNLALFKTAISDKLNNRFLYYLLQCDLIKIQFELVSNGGVLGFMSLGQIRNLIIPKLFLNEQIEIVKEIDSACLKIATAISLKEQEIEKLKEYKATLINSAITGKIKVC
jgi:type I restriction enzyme S subunit